MWSPYLAEAHKFLLAGGILAWCFQWSLFIYLDGRCGRLAWGWDEWNFAHFDVILSLPIDDDVVRRRSNAYSWCYERFMSKLLMALIHRIFLLLFWSWHPSWTSNRWIQYRWCWKPSLAVACGHGECFKTLSDERRCCFWKLPAFFVRGEVGYISLSRHPRFR